ncbi:MAG: hypothetical protein AB8G26_17595 [Ilumatobacter sp.]
MIGVVWHVWIGVALTAVTVLVMFGLVGAYLASVQRKRFPNGKQRRYQDL